MEEDPRRLKKLKEPGAWEPEQEDRDSQPISSAD